MRVQISKPVFSTSLVGKIAETLRIGRISQGRAVIAFEKRLKAMLSARYVIAVNSGTNALWLALKASGIGPGDEVIVPSFSFIATANAVLYVGAKPVFADIDPQSFTLSAKTIRGVISKKTKAVVMVSLYGNPEHSEEVAKLCAVHHLTFVEDAAQSFGAKTKNKCIGTLGIGCFSFYATKNVTCGEGGAIVVPDGITAKRLQSLRNHGNTGREYEYDTLGYNARMTDIQALLGLDQLKHFSNMQADRLERVERFFELVTNPRVKLPQHVIGHAWHQFTIRSKRRNQLQKALARRGYETKVYYPIPIHEQPLYRALGYGGAVLAETEKACREVLSLPIHPFVKLGDIGRMAGIINRYG